MGFLKTVSVLLLFTGVAACNNTVTQKTTTTTQAAPPTAATPEATTPEIGATALPSFALADVNGKTVNLQQFRGKKLFVNLWATWCPPCRAEMPSIEKLFQATDKEKVQFVMLSLDNDFETAKKYVQANNLSVPIFYPAGNTPKLFEVEGIPATFIFNEEGKLIEQRVGSDDYNTPTYRKLFGAIQ
jgi:thiol-disulfide isomerase/thioredoxin